MTLVVHHSAMYVTQKQSHDSGSPSILARLLTPVQWGPATFSTSGSPAMAPSSKLELDQYGDNAADFSTNVLTAWAPEYWVVIPGVGVYTWDGTKWVTSTLATGISINGVSNDAPGKFTGGHAPLTEAELQSSAFGQTTAWTNGGAYIVLGGVGSGGPKFYWAGATDKWKPGVVPWWITPVSGAEATVYQRYTPIADLAGLRAKFVNPENFAGGDNSAWAMNQWIVTNDSNIYRWDGSDWVAAVAATHLLDDDPEEFMVADGYAPQTAGGLPATGYAGFTDAWSNGQFITLGGFDSGGDKYYWDGSAWQSGTAPAGP